MPVTDSSRPAWVCTASDNDSARRARREFVRQITRWHVPRAAVQESELIFGELIGNAIRHAGGNVRVRLRLDGNQPVLCVTDRAARALMDVPDRGPESETGRGLQIVRALARRVWIERGQRTKTVCAALPYSVSFRRAEKGEVSA
jgi:anti-sigma regulatory factor (Ser/Thr protein kinase)